MRNLNLDQLQTLVAIADLGTLAAASRALHLAAPTVSLHVSELEARLGYALVERGARQATLTPAGAVLVDAARRLLRDADQAVDQARRVALGHEGKVRLGTATGVLVHLLPAVLQRLAAQYPAVGVEVEVLSSMDAMRRIADGALDVGIVALPQAANPQVVVTRWRSDPMVAFIPSSWKPPAKVDPEWLACRPLIANDASTLMHRLVAEWFAQAGLTPRARIELNYTEAMKSMVSAGYGAAVLPLEGQSMKPAPHQRFAVRPLSPRLQRHLAVAHRPRPDVQGALPQVLEVLLAASETPRRRR